MNRPAAVLALLLLVGGVGGWLLDRASRVEEPDATRTEARNLPAAEEVDQEALQELATASCICERSGDGSEEQCWKEYRDKIARFEVAGYGTACAPVSTSADCIQTTFGEKCVVTGYDVNAAADEDRDVLVCTEGEAQAIEAASLDAWTVDGQPVSSDDEEAWALANERERAAIVSVIDRIRGGEKFSPSRGQEGCV